MRVLGKPELSNAIKLVDLETLMSNFGPPSPRAELPNQQPANGREDEDRQKAPPAEDVGSGNRQPKLNKRKQQIT